MVLGTGIAVALGALMAGGDDPPFELCGMYGWKYKNGRPTPIRRKPDAGKERAYTHDHPTFGAEVVDHLKEHYKGAHYPACKSLVFIPTKDGEAHRDSVQGLIDASYLPPMTDDPCMASFVKRAHEQGRVLPWRYLHYLRTLRATGYNVDLSQDFLDEHNRLLWNAELPDDAELANALYRDCAHVVDAPGRTTNAEAEPFILDNFLESRGQRTFLLGTHDALNEGYRANKNLVLSPWLPIDERYGTFGWNLTINKASMQCFAKEAKQRNWDVPFVVKLNHEPGYYQRIDFFTNADGTAKPDSQSQYLGFFLVRYDRNDEGSELCNSEHLRVDEDIPHESPATHFAHFSAECLFAPYATMFALGARLTHTPPHICNAPHAPIPAPRPILAPSTPPRQCAACDRISARRASRAHAYPNIPNIPYTTVFARHHILAQHTHTRSIYHIRSARICRPIHPHKSYTCMARGKTRRYYTLHARR